MESRIKGMLPPHGTSRHSYCCDSMSFHTLLSLWRRPKPMAGAVVETTSSSALQRGHSAFILSHLSTQSLWKKCPHGSNRSSSLSTYLAKQIQQTCNQKSQFSFALCTRREIAVKLTLVKKNISQHLQQKQPVPCLFQQPRPHCHLHFHFHLHYEASSI